MKTRLWTSGLLFYAWALMKGTVKLQFRRIEVPCQSFLIVANNDQICPNAMSSKQGHVHNRWMGKRTNQLTHWLIVACMRLRSIHCIFLVTCMKQLWQGFIIWGFLLTENLYRITKSTITTFFKKKLDCCWAGITTLWIYI